MCIYECGCYVRIIMYSEYLMGRGRWHGLFVHMYVRSRDMCVIDREYIWISFLLDYMYVVIV